MSLPPGTFAEVVLLTLIGDDIVHVAAVYYLGFYENFPLHPLPMEVARQQGDKSVRGCDRLLATLCLFLPTESKAAFLWEFIFKSKVFLSLLLSPHD